MPESSLAVPSLLLAFLLHDASRIFLHFPVFHVASITDTSDTEVIAHNSAGPAMDIVWASG